jgi:hypothetical protein
MENTSKLGTGRDRDIFYYRQRAKNRLFEAITSFYASEAERRGITKKDIAEFLKRDPAQITRWLTVPSNLTLDTISDLLLSLGAEMDYSVARFADRAQPNEMHPLIAQILTNRVTMKEEKRPATPNKRYEPAPPPPHSSARDFQLELQRQ